MQRTISIIAIVFLFLGLASIVEAQSTSIPYANAIVGVELMRVITTPSPGLPAACFGSPNLLLTCEDDDSGIEPFFPGTYSGAFSDMVVGMPYCGQGTDEAHPSNPNILREVVCGDSLGVPGYAAIVDIDCRLVPGSTGNVILLGTIAVCERNNADIITRIRSVNRVGSQVFTTVQVKNQGIVTAPASVTRISTSLNLLYFLPTNVVNYPVPSLAPGQSATITRIDTVPIGTMRLFVQGDYLNSVPEINEFNNDTGPSRFSV